MARTKKEPETETAVKKPSARKTSAAKTPAPRKKAPAKAKQGDLIFALDIGTRTVVGTVGKSHDDIFEILDSVSAAHTKRAVIDGQIEDIDEVAKVVKKVKTQLESNLNMKLTKVSIAAAGRALKTQHVKVDIDIDGKDSITEDMVKSFEIEAITKAQEQLDSERNGEPMDFYCVGHSVVNYFLDGYPMKSFVGHKGKLATVEMIAAFLPSLVVESLYAVMDKNRLEVTSLTLEPIAAMNVIIPPEVRLINIALVDIGAGTSDIAISRNGSIVAYAMATTAGDEITEEIIKRYLVDFDTAEAMKQNPGGAEISYTDILGLPHTISAAEFFGSLNPAVDLLAKTISENILAVNGEAPAAVFLVGGGSRIPDLPKLISEKLSMPAERVAVGGQTSMKNVSLGKTKLIGPEYVTPIGIGVTATLQQGYDFSTVTLNHKKVRVFNTKAITVLDILMIGGFKSSQLIGRSGRSLSFTLNDEKQVLKGEISTPAQIIVNGEEANISTPVRQNDDIRVTPATNGISAEIHISDLAGELSDSNVMLENIPYPVGTTALVNGKSVTADYLIQNFDDVKILTIATLSDLLNAAGLDFSYADFFRGKEKLSLDSVIVDGDRITMAEKEIPVPAPEPVPEEIYEEEIPQEEEAVVETSAEEPVEIPEEKPAVPDTIGILLNGRTIHIPKRSDGSPNLFLELTEYADLDTSKPHGSGKIELILNGKEAGYTDPIHDGDIVTIEWGKA